MANKLTIFLPKGQALSLSTDAVSSGKYVRLANPGSSTKYGPVAIAVSSSAVVGPFNDDRHYAIYQDQGSISYSLAESGVFSSDDFLDEDDMASDSASQVPSQQSIKAYIDLAVDNLGTAATGVSAVEYGDGYNHTTVLTVDSALPAIAGGADLAVGKLLYTLPAGACVVKSAYMSMAITQSEGNINADTPEVGLGTTIGSGAVAVLSGTAAFENILTGQVADDCNGTAEVKTVADQVLVIESADDHTIYFNAADGWAASGDAAAGLAGTVIINWQFIV